MEVEKKLVTRSDYITALAIVMRGKLLNKRPPCITYRNMNETMQSGLIAPPTYPNLAFVAFLVRYLRICKQK